LELNPKNVEDTLLSCLFQGEEAEEAHRTGRMPDRAVLVEGIVSKFALDPDKLWEKRFDILSMLNQLPEDFMADKGGGMFFLEACHNKDGEQWTGERRQMENLFVLGMAIWSAECLMPRELWAVLPGGMPYFVIDVDADGNRRVPPSNP